MSRRGSTSSCQHGWHHAGAFRASYRARWLLSCPQVRWRSAPAPESARTAINPNSRSVHFSRCTLMPLADRYGPGTIPCPSQRTLLPMDPAASRWGRSGAHAPSDSLTLCLSKRPLRTVDSFGEWMEIHGQGLALPASCPTSSTASHDKHVRHLPRGASMAATKRCEPPRHDGCECLLHYRLAAAASSGQPELRS